MNPKKNLASNAIKSVNKFLENKNRDMLLLYNKEQDASDIFKILQFFYPEVNLYHLPAWDILPYERVSPSADVMLRRTKTLVEISNSNHNILIASSASYLQKIPNAYELSSSFLKLNIGDKYSQDNLVKFLSSVGYLRSPTANNAGEFAVRGDLIDIVTNALAYRVNFLWDKIDSIKLFDIDTQITNSKMDYIELYPPSELILNETNIANFKNNFLQNFGVNHISDPIYQNILKGSKPIGAEHLLPLFYDELSSVPALLDSPIIIYDDFFIDSCEERLEMIRDLYESRTDNSLNLNTRYFAVKPEEFWDIDYKLEKSFNIDDSKIELLPSFLEEAAISERTSSEVASYYISEQKKSIILSASSKNSSERLSELFKITDKKIEFKNIDSLSEIGKYNIAILPVDSGFVSNDYIVIGESDILGEKIRYKVDSRKKLKNILTELDALSIGELIIHKDHGIGKFLGIENISISGKAHDCIKLLYKGDDRLFIPVENIDLIKKYGHEYAELDKLGNLGWQRRKAKVKERIGLIAKSLIDIAAKRELILMDNPNINNDYYQKFCSKFPYIETEDQMNSIAEIRSDLESNKPMDRLLCGDVGFGKTEVAMRAAFFVVSNNRSLDIKQVAIIAPTTILARQHYINFQERFRGFDIKIEMISRLSNRAQISLNKEELASGKLDIIIGTHALLSDGVKFANLNLLIIDEEQHFGVKQKEKLKNLKSDIHVLSMSATPIPRTLQMSILDLKQLSLITTPPIDRLSVKTSMIMDDEVLLREVLMKEYLRGGQSFYVAPRIADLENIVEKLKRIVPELKFEMAHGQMSPSELDNIMNDYYEGSFDILLSTTIIESGIDIKSANSMIIHNSHMLGLSQLYQLRGRVGRGKVRGYVYLLFDKKLATEDAMKRLESIASIDALGGSFAIASHDMDDRGFGNLLGAEQSGNIKEVGAELYNDMLKDAIESFRNTERESEEISPNINIGVPVFIPDFYIKDPILRMSIYRRAGEIKSSDDYMNFVYEMEDRFGKIPEEMNNLLEIMKIKNICKKLYIEKFDLGEKACLIKFYDSKPVHDMVMTFIKKYPRIAQIRPDSKLLIKIENIKDCISHSMKLLGMLQL